MPPKIEIGQIVKVVKTDEEWRKLLAPEAYKVLRHESTERPFTDNSSEHKFDSGTGWHSFWQPIDPKVVESTTDYKLIFPRTEVHCARCEGHQGHIFKDGPKPTGLRYCINGVALKFVAA